MSKSPNKGNNTKGINPVAYIGTASVVHQIVISMATPAVNQATLSSPSGGLDIKKNKSITKPLINPNMDILPFVNNY